MITKKIVIGCIGVLAFAFLFIVPAVYEYNLHVSQVSVSGSTQPSLIQNSQALNVDGAYSYRLTVTIHNNDFFANQTMLGQGYVPSCRSYCINGITYTLDPSIFITNNGRDFEQCKVFGNSGTITCVNADKASIMGISAATGTIAATNSTCSGIITSGGLADVNGTLTPGAAGTTVSSTLAHTWTAAETDSAIQVACLTTELHGGSHIVLYAIANFGPDTLTTGNTIALTWVVSRT